MDLNDAATHEAYVYVAGTVTGNLHFGQARAINSLALTAMWGRNPRIREHLPFTVLRSWRVQGMTTAISVASVLRNANPDLVWPYLLKQDLDLMELIENVRGPGVIIFCPRCGVLRRPFEATGVCGGCYRKEAKGKCARCHQSSHHLSADHGKCPKCVEIESHPLHACARCRKERRITDRERDLCRECVNYLKQSTKYPKRSTEPKSKPRLIQCIICGKARSAVRKKRNVCDPCARLQNAKPGNCLACGKYRVIKNRLRRLCSRCEQARFAPGRVRKFILNFQSPFPGSQEAFEMLVRTVVPEAITPRRAARIINFGKFMQSHELISPLTWVAIDKVLVSVPPRNGAAIDIRSSMLSVGHLLAKEGKIGTKADHLVIRKLTNRIEEFPIAIRPVVEDFAQWSLGRKTTCKHVIAQVEQVFSICKWCAERGGDSVFSLTAENTDRYMLETYWNLRCDCGSLAKPTSDGNYGGAICVACSSVGPFQKEARWSPERTRKVRARLFVFFEWARLNALVTINPVKTAPTGAKQQIQHCSPQVLMKIFEYIQSPDSDPTGALILYLTTTYLFTGWELQHVKVPNLKGESGKDTLAAVYGFVVPDRPISLGRASPARDIRQFSFLETERPWLEPLLKRFQAQRTKFLSGRKSDFLFVAPKRLHENVPVSINFLSRRVRGITSQISPKIGLQLLKKTASVHMADLEGPEIINSLGYKEQWAMGYRLFPRQLIG